jgi:hypothetical protein
MQNSLTLPAAVGQNPAAEIFTDEIAAIYIGNVEARAIRSWRHTRGLPYLRLTAKTIRIRKSDLDKWLASHRIAITKGAV